MKNNSQKHVPEKLGSLAASDNIELTQNNLSFQKQQ